MTSHVAVLRSLDPADIHSDLWDDYEADEAMILEAIAEGNQDRVSAMQRAREERDAVTLGNLMLNQLDEYRRTYIDNRWEREQRARAEEHQEAADERRHARYQP